MATNMAKVAVGLLLLTGTLESRAEWLQTHEHVQDRIRYKFEHVLRFWDARSGKMVKELRGKQASVARFSPDSRLYATQGSGSICYLATVPDASVVQTIATPNGPWRFSFSADGRLLAGASLREVTPRLWETASGKEVAMRRRRGSTDARSQGGAGATYAQVAHRSLTLAARKKRKYTSRGQDWLIFKGLEFER